MEGGQMLENVLLQAKSLGVNSRAKLLNYEELPQLGLKGPKNAVATAIL